MSEKAEDTRGAHPCGDSVSIALPRRPIHAFTWLRVGNPYELPEELFPQVNHISGQTDQVAAYVSNLLGSTTTRSQLGATDEMKSRTATRGSAARAAAAAAEGVSLRDLVDRWAWRVNDVHTVLDYVAETLS